MRETPEIAPDVSVILPTYNADRIITRAISSALSQEGVAVEVVVVDDASGDDTVAVVKALADDDPRIRLLISERNGGAGVARNRAIDAAQGRWLALLDADDAFAPGRLARLVSVAEREGLEAVADLHLLYDIGAGALSPTQLPASGELEIVTLRRFLESAAGAATVMDYGLMQPVLARSLVERRLWRYPEKTRHGEDFMVVFEVLSAGVLIGLLHEARYVYSTRLGEISGAYSEASVTNVDYLAIAADTEALIERLEREPVEPAEISRDEAIELLRRRIGRCLAMNRRHGWNTLRKGAWRRHWKWLRQDSRNPGLLLEMTGKKLSAQLGLKRPS